jgi:FAD/FMN-containing dehydrogenase
MNRRAFLQASASTVLLGLLPRQGFAQQPALEPVRSPWADCRNAPDSAACRALFENVRNPYYVGDTAALTQSLGWVDAWTSEPSRYAVVARNAHDIAAAIAYARRRGLRVVVKGGGHSYLGTSNARDSLLVWTRQMNEIHVDRDTVTMGSGTIWAQAYNAVTTKSGRYVQGGGCTTVGVAGLIQSGGFGSFSKRFGLAAASLVEAEIVTADGKIRKANAAANPDLFWALKGGGGGTFGVISKVTVRLHDLPEYFGAAVARIKASSDQSYRRLIREFVGFYREHLFNEHWGEQVGFGMHNIMRIDMVAQGMDSQQIAAVWKPFFDWVARSPRDYTLEAQPILLGIPARHWWDVAFWRANAPTAITIDPRPGHENNWWWAGDGDQAGQVLYGYESLWLPESLLQDGAQERLADAFYAASRKYGFSLHFNKGLAGAPSDAIAAARDTATNPSVLTAFALAICADAQGPAYPGVRGHEPDVAAARNSARAIHDCVNELRAVAPDGGSYVSESNYFEENWQRSYWGSNYSRLAAIKQKYDPDGVFSVHHGVTSG